MVHLFNKLLHLIKKKMFDSLETFDIQMSLLSGKDFLGALLQTSIIK